MKTNNRTYTRTHPWISFNMDLRDASHRLWFLLGEAYSKCEHIAGVPLRPATKENLMELYLAKGIAATTAIEGNSLSLDDVEKHISGELYLPPSKEYLGREIDNIIEAVNMVGISVINGEIAELSVDYILDLNNSVLRNLPLREGVIPGRIRTYNVGVNNYKGAPAEDCEFLLETMCTWLNGMTIGELNLPPIVKGVIKAVIAHLYMAWIHPFGDGNGRTARLLEFKILLEAGVPSVAAHLLSNHYNQTRHNYYTQLGLASRSGGHILPFIEYAVQGFIDGLREQLDIVRKQQLDVTWRDFVHDTFKNMNKASEMRLRHLILDLSMQDKPIPFLEIPDISPRMAKAYMGKHQKTISRDLNKLIEMNLVEKTMHGYKPKREIILAFLPERLSDKRRLAISEQLQ